MTARWLVVFTDGTESRFEVSSHDEFIAHLTALRRGRWGEIRCVLRLT